MKLSRILQSARKEMYLANMPDNPAINLVRVVYLDRGTTRIYRDVSLDRIDAINRVIAASFDVAAGGSQPSIRGLEMLPDGGVGMDTIR